MSGENPESPELSSANAFVAKRFANALLELGRVREAYRQNPVAHDEEDPNLQHLHSLARTYDVEIIEDANGLFDAVEQEIQGRIDDLKA